MFFAASDGGGTGAGLVGAAGASALPGGVGGVIAGAFGAYGEGSWLGCGSVLRRRGGKLTSSGAAPPAGTRPPPFGAVYPLARPPASGGRGGTASRSSGGRGGSG